MTSAPTRGGSILSKIADRPVCGGRLAVCDIRHTRLSPPWGKPLRCGNAGALPLPSLGVSPQTGPLTTSGPSSRQPQGHDRKGRSRGRNDLLTKHGKGRIVRKRRQHIIFAFARLARSRRPLPEKAQRVPSRPRR